MWCSIMGGIMIYLKIFSLLDSQDESKLEIASENIYQTELHKSYFCSPYPLNIFIKKKSKRYRV